MAVETQEQIELGAGLREIASEVVEHAMKAGATAADAIARDGNEFSTLVRLGEVETLKESGARALGLRVFVGKHAAATHTSDFSREGIGRLVSGAIELARATSEDPDAGLPEPSQLGSLKEDLDLYYDDVYSLSTVDRIDYARRAEAAAMALDPRITNSDGASFDAATGYKVLANSLGFVGEYRRSYCSVSAVPIAHAEGSAMQRDYWYSTARTMQKLESPESVGRKAAERTLRRLGARKVATQRVPVIFDPMVSRGLIDHIFDAVNGDAIYRHASYLAGKLGQPVAGENITIIDDGTMVGGFGSSPFDGEGVPTRRTVVIDRGVLKSYLLNTYTARKLKLQTTGNAARGLTGNPGIGSGNFFLQPGAKNAQEIVRDVRSGLYVTEFLGFGVNLVTGDFSRGASGLWIENGEFIFPVEEITVAGNLKDMFRNVSEIGNDLEFRSSIAAPTLRIDGMTVAGE
ncbi:MAG TPA: metallopeptidase TldD-related protein [Terriglobales bacterium]|nr:metallopeptidase TldD-related protein [Terriglobales bacterium]